MRAEHAVETLDVSLVIPVLNEQDTLISLADQISTALKEVADTYEIIFVDDGSTDGSPEVMAALAEERDYVKCITFRRNFGKAAALDVGFGAARGAIVITMDADLQDDPKEIPRFIKALEGGLDVVSGWKQVRHDPLHKTLPSRIFNAVVSRLSGVRLNDFNCGFKGYRAEALDGLTLYGELHRFVPVLLHWRGFRIGEIAVTHHARRFGSSKYGLTRLLKGALDFLGVMLNTRYATRPLHIFGAAGAVFGMAGIAILSYLSALWVAGLGPIGDRPLLLLGMLLVMTSFQFITIGLLGEFIQRQGAGRELPYRIKSTANLGDQLASTAVAAPQLADLARQMRENHPDGSDDNSRRHDRAARSEIRQSKSAASAKSDAVPRRARARTA